MTINEKITSTVEKYIALKNLGFSFRTEPKETPEGITEADGSREWVCISPANIGHAGWDDLDEAVREVWADREEIAAG